VTPEAAEQGKARVEEVFRAEYGRAVATLIRSLGDIGLAEEAVQDAFVTALRRWPGAGIPPNPGGWIVTTARNRALDRLRRERTRDQRQVAATRLLEQEQTADPSAKLAWAKVKFADISGIFDGWPNCV